MNEFEEALAEYIGEDRLSKIQKIKVGIAGAGGLGSNCAYNLVRSGFNKLKLVDFDTVQYSNLNRQFYFSDQISMMKVDALEINLKRINPDIELEISNDKVTYENVAHMFEDCHVVVEAFDNANDKAMLVEHYAGTDKLVVAASGLAGWGDSDEIRVKKVNSNFYMVGDFMTEANADNPPISPRVNITAGKQADIVLEYVMNRM